MKKAKRSIVTVLIAVTLALLTTGCALLSPLIVIAEDNARVKRMNNPYVNSDYDGWERVAFFETHTFALPESWYAVQLDDSTYALYQDDTVIAYVGKLGGDSKYAETSFFCEAMVESEEIASPYEQAGTDNYGNGCYSYHLTVTKSNSEQEKYYYLFADRFGSDRMSGDCGMLFLNDAIDQAALFDYVIAIAYSYEWHND